MGWQSWGLSDESWSSYEELGLYPVGFLKPWEALEQEITPKLDSKEANKSSVCQIKKR